MSLFKHNDRSNTFRNEILLRHISSVMTDEERAELFDLPEGCRLRENTRIFSPENLKCGKYVWIGEGSILDASGGLEIGDYTQIGTYCSLWTHDSYLQALNSETCISSESIIRSPIKIGHHTYLSANIIVYPGITIGNYVKVYPMTVINKNIPDNSTVRGIPVGKLEELENRIEDIERALGV